MNNLLFYFLAAILDSVFLTFMWMIDTKLYANSFEHITYRGPNDIILMSIYKLILLLPLVELLVISSLKKLLLRFKFFAASVSLIRICLFVLFALLTGAYFGFNLFDPIIRTSYIPLFLHWSASIILSSFLLIHLLNQSPFPPTPPPH